MFCLLHIRTLAPELRTNSSPILAIVPCSVRCACVLNEVFWSTSQVVLDECMVATMWKRNPPQESCLP
jgi:hypothetical protein